jgi:hypothetical protein
MRKILISWLVLVLLSGCSLWKKDTDFTSLYSNYVVAPIDALESFSDYLGYNQKEQITGSFKWAVEIPVLLSGAFSSDYKIWAYSKDGLVNLENIVANFESMVSTSTFEAKKLSLVTIGGDLYMLYDGIKTSLLPPEAMEIFNKYNNKWLSYTEADMNNAFSGGAMEDELSRVISKNISEMTLDDVRGYLTEYPILKQEKELSSSGSKRAFEVSLDKDKLVELITQVQSDITSSGSSPEEIQSLKNGLVPLSITGTVVFDVDNNKFIDLMLYYSNAWTPIAQMELDTDTAAQRLKITSLADKTEVLFTATHTDENRTFNLSLLQDGIEVGKSVMTVAMKGKMFQKLTLEIMAQGVTVSLEHARTSDTAFEGRMILPVGTVSWNGTIDGDKTTSFVLKWAMPMGSIDLNLTKDGDKLRGPLIVKQGGEEILRADMGLLFDKWVFGFDVNVANPTASGSALKATLDLDYDQKAMTDKITVPSGAVPLENLTNELEAILPEDTLMEDDQMFIDDEIPMDDAALPSDLVLPPTN